MMMTTVVSGWRPAGRLALAMLIALSAATAHAQPTDPAATPLDTLKQAYLECERTAVGGELETLEIMRCSVIYEELKRRAFGGDFRRLKAWADRQIAAAGA